MCQRLAIGILFAALFAARLGAQAVSGTIYGSVHDASGASIAGAKVSVVNAATNYTREQVTGATGDFLFASLPLGQYTLSVTQAGFDDFSQRGLTLQVDQQLRAEVTLTIGRVAEKVNVVAESPLVNTANAENSQVIERNRVEQLPLNGRNFTQLIQLTTGTTTGATGDTQNNLVINQFRGGTNFTANGMRTLYNNFILDGVDNNENAWNFGGVVILPVVDAIQEFKVSTGNFSSEFGRAVGGVVNVQTRSGSNQYHGNLFEFLRNSKFDANEFFSNANGKPRNDFRQNQFGGTFGGPVLRNKLFFFTDYQGTRMRRQVPFVSSTPTVEARGGDFTNTRFGAIYDPFTGRTDANGAVTRDPFPGRRIPSNRFDPLSVKFLQYFPDPNTNPGAIALNLINNPKWSRGGNQGDIRVDYNLDRKGTVFGRYSVDRSYQLFPNDLTTEKNPFGGGGRGNNIDLGAQNGALNMTYLAKPNVVLEGRFGLSRFNFAGLPLGAGLPGVAAVQAPGVGSNAVTATALTITGLTAFGPTTGVPNYSIQTTFQGVFNATITHGRHSIRTGVDFRRPRHNNFFVSTQTSGAFNFAPGMTSQTGVTGGGVGFASFLLGLQDTIGRGYIAGGIGRRNIETGSYIQEDFKATNRLNINLGMRWELTTPMVEIHDRMSMLDINTGKLIVAGENGKFGRGLRNTNWRNFGPRLGLAYRLPDSTRTVLRTGYAISYIEEYGGNSANPFQNPPNAFTQTLTYTTTQLPPTRFSDGIPPAWAIDLNNPFGTIRMFDPNVRAASAQQWDFSLQREMGANWLLEAAYVGTKGTHLLLIVDANQAIPGAGGIAQRRPLFRIAPNVQTTVASNIGNSTYHSAQMKLQKRLSNGFYFVAAYTLSKLLDDGEGDNVNGTPGVGRFNQAQNALARNLEKGPADTDATHRFVVSFGYELPFGKGKRFGNQPGVLDRVIGGWQVSGITTFSSGNPFDVLYNPVTLNNGGSQRPNRIRDGRVDNWTLDRYFDLSAFSAPAAFQYGNSGRDILRGPGVKNLDVSLIKDVAFRERYRVQYRADFFNSTNTPQFNPPGNTVGTPQAGVISSTRFATNRQIQFVLKLFF